MTTRITIDFADGVGTQVALQRLSTLCSHQRTPLVELTLRSGDTGGPVAELVFGPGPADRTTQLVKRLDRDWSVRSVELGTTGV